MMCKSAHETYGPSDNRTDLCTATFSSIHDFCLFKKESNGNQIEVSAWWRLALMFHSVCPCLTEDKFSVSRWFEAGMVGGVQVL